jgi:hypothetical protein
LYAQVFLGGRRTRGLGARRLRTAFKVPEDTRGKLWDFGKTALSLMRSSGRPCGIIRCRFLEATIRQLRDRSMSLDICVTACMALSSARQTNCHFVASGLFAVRCRVQGDQAFQAELPRRSGRRDRCLSGGSRGGKRGGHQTPSGQAACGAADSGRLTPRPMVSRCR